MKKVIIIGAENFLAQDNFRNMTKNLEVEGPESMSVSDGFHTIDELYRHRIELFIALCKRYPDQAWRSETHTDGTMYEGWFIMGLFSEKGKQISYHLPKEKWPQTEFAKAKQPEWDGHFSEDVLKRLSDLI